MGVFIAKLVSISADKFFCPEPGSKFFISSTKYTKLAWSVSAINFAMVFTANSDWSCIIPETIFFLRSSKLSCELPKSLYDIFPAPVEALFMWPKTSKPSLLTSFINMAALPSLLFIIPCINPIDWLASEFLIIADIRLTSLLDCSIRYFNLVPLRLNSSVL